MKPQNFVKYLLIILFLLTASGCAEYYVETDPDSFAFKLEHQIVVSPAMTAALNPCNCDAIENGTDKILCHAGDCACHAALVQKTFDDHAKNGGGFPR